MLSAQGCETWSTKLSHDSNTVCGCLADLWLWAGNVVDHLLSKVALVVERARSCVLNEVIENTQTPLVIGPSVVGLLKLNVKIELEED